LNGAKGARGQALRRGLFLPGSTASLTASPVHISLHVMAAHMQETPLLFFQHKAGQAAGGVPSRVDSDPIGANLWDQRWRVAVHHQFSVLRLTRQERIADGQEIISILTIERHARSDSGMAEKVVADRN